MTLRVIFFSFLLSCTIFESFAQPPDEVAREIARLKTEIERVRSEREDQAAQMRRDRTESEEYGKRNAERKASLRRQIDSTHEQARLSKLKNDSLQADISAIQARIRESQLLETEISGVILRASELLLGQISSFTPLVREQYEGAIKYLVADIRAGSVENTEALFRFMRIVQDVRTVSQEIQVVEGSSVVEQIRGVAYRLRVGGVFEAVVDDAGERAFVWTPAAEGDSARWVAVDNVAAAKSIRSAIMMREGKTVPQLVELPLGVAAPLSKGGADVK